VLGTCPRWTCTSATPSLQIKHKNTSSGHKY
jgi:hypothetical protein